VTHGIRVADITDGFQKTLVLGNELLLACLTPE
jgi:hypothetical protein